MEDSTLFVLYLVSLAALGLFGIHKFYLLYLYRKYKNQTPETPPAPDEWPLVVVQLPIFNERYVIRRLLRAVARLSYPLDKLHVQVLDDSTDDTVRITARLVRLLQRRGLHIDHVRRPERTGFKAGALAYGTERTDAEYIAIFDADFVPDPDFLKQTLPHLMQAGIGMVQTRWGHINRNYSLLTRLQSIFLDAHFLIEHLARNRTGRFFNFNGTAGVWRKQAVIDAGGWQHDTLTEDLDLSYRSQLAGWKFRYLPDVVSPAELPAEMNAYKNQQHRWAKGAVQTAFKLVPRIWKSDFSFAVRTEAIIHLCSNFGYLLMVVPGILLVPVVKYQMTMPEPPWDLIIIYFLIFISATLSVMIYYAVAIKAALGKYWPEMIQLPLLMALGIGLSLNNGRAALEAIFGHQTDFKRTPKFNLHGKKGSWKHKLYRPGRSYQHIIEILIGIYFTYGLLYFISQEVFLSTPFFALFLVGFFYIGILSLAGQRR